MRVTAPRMIEEGVDDSKELLLSFKLIALWPELIVVPPNVCDRVSTLTPVVGAVTPSKDKEPPVMRSEAVVAIAAAFADDWITSWPALTLTSPVSEFAMALLMIIVPAPVLVKPMDPARFDLKVPVTPEAAERTGAVPARVMMPPALMVPVVLKVMPLVKTVPLTGAASEARLNNAMLPGPLMLSHGSIWAGVNDQLVAAVLHVSPTSPLQLPTAAWADGRRMSGKVKIEDARKRSLLDFMGFDLGF